MPRRLPLLVVTVVATAAIAFPLGVLASHQFGDVPDSNPFHADIEALADSGVTLGCGNGNYCPSAFVTREQMAAFMNRLGALSEDKTPVVNADKVDGKDEVLGVGPIVIRQGAGWLPHFDNDADIDVASGVTFFNYPSAGARTVILPLQDPGTVAGQAYGIASVQVCHDDQDLGTITQTVAYKAFSGGSGFLIDDGTDRALSEEGCYTISDPEPDAADRGMGLMISMSVTAEATVGLADVTTTWVPVDAPG